MARISIRGYEPQHLSHSTVNGFRSCGKRFELTKVMHMEERPGLAALGGNVVHTVSEVVDHLIEEHGFDFFLSDVDNSKDGTQE